MAGHAPPALRGAASTSGKASAPALAALKRDGFCTCVFQPVVCVRPPGTCFHTLPTCWRVAPGLRDVFVLLHLAVLPRAWRCRGATTCSGGHYLRHPTARAGGGSVTVVLWFYFKGPIHTDGERQFAKTKPRDCRCVGPEPPRCRGTSPRTHPWNGPRNARREWPQHLLTRWDGAPRLRART